MAGTKKTRLPEVKEGSRRQHCPEHKELCKPIMHIPGRKIQYHCPAGCVLSKNEVFLK